MILVGLLIFSLLTVGVFLIPLKKKQAYSTFLLLAGISISLVWVAKALFMGQVIEYKFSFFFLANTHIYIDRISGLFILLVNIVAITTQLYSKGYLKPYHATKSATEISLHHFGFMVLWVSMILLLIFQDSFSFLMAWELMTASSLLVLLVDIEKKQKRKTALNYLIQMHICFFVLLFAFSYVGAATGESGFNAITAYFRDNPNFWVFVLFLVGFGIKAGLVPLHTWLPDVHPSAPGNISGFMSGAIIKMGVYGIVRLLFAVQTDFYAIGSLLVCIGVISGLYGIIMAIVQTDIKRLLAYSSIENIGIICTALGIAVLGKFWNNDMVIVAGLTAGLLHTFNHALFKSLLFLSTASLYQSTHTQNIEQLGGLVKRMPYTSRFFLLGAIAICALPPLNGFISEFILYNGLFNAVKGLSYFSALSYGMIGIITLTLIGGLAVIAFSKAFGVAFLGEPRSEAAANAKEVKRNMLFPLLIPASLIVFVGLFPSVLVKFIAKISYESFGCDFTNTFGLIKSSLNTLDKVSLVSFILLIIIGALLFIRKRKMASVPIEKGDTWGCGYTAPTAKQQYTGNSYVNDFAKLTQYITGWRSKMRPLQETDIFPQSRSHRTRNTDVFKHSFIQAPIKWLNKRLNKLAVFQTGKIQHYILYALVFLILIFALTYFNLL